MIRIGLPTKGRLSEPTETLFRSVGIATDHHPRSLRCLDKTSNIEVVFVHPKDVGKYVENGLVDLAVTAQDILEEHPYNVEVLLNLGIARCSIVLATLFSKAYSQAADLENKSIGTSYSNITQKWFEKKGVKVEIKALSGGLEIAPYLGYCDAITDSYDTGISAKVNDLKVLDTLINSQGILIGRLSLVKAKEIYCLIESLEQQIPEKNN